MVNFCSFNDHNPEATAPRGYQPVGPDRSMFHPFCRLNDERPPTERFETAFRTCLRRWFSQYRKTFRGDELYSPSCQRLTRPAPSYPYVRTAFHPGSAPRRALAKHYRTLPPVFPSNEGNLIYCLPTTGHFFVATARTFVVFSSRRLLGRTTSLLKLIRDHSRSSFTKAHRESRQFT